MATPGNLRELDSMSLSDALALMDDWEMNEVATLLELGGHDQPTRVDTTQSLPLTIGGEHQVCAPPPPHHASTQKRQAVNLRSQLEELETVLSSAQRRNPTTASPTWMSVARAQQRLLLRAQATNKRLRRMIHSDLANASKTQRLLERAASMAKKIALNEAVYRPFRLEYGGPHVDPQYQLQRLAALCLETESVFASGVFANRSSNACFRDVELRDCRACDDERMEMAFSMAWQLPFAVADVAEALWLQTKFTPRDKRMQWTDLYEDGSDRISQFISIPMDNSTTSSSGKIKHGQTASRRLENTQSCEGSSTAIIVSTLELGVFANGTLKGNAQSDTWIRVHSVSPPPVEADAPRSLVQWCCRVRVNPLKAPAQERPPQRHAWISSALSRASRTRQERNLDWTIQALENLLLDRAQAARHASRG